MLLDLRALTSHATPPSTIHPSFLVIAGIDAILASRRFNQLGGLQLDRDVRALIAYAADLTQRPVRPRPYSELF